jgi:inosose dehydratase
MTRRDAVATLLASGSLAAAPRYRPLIATQSYVWTQLFDRDKRPLAEGVGDMVAACRRAGYRRIELVSRFLDGAVLEKTHEALRRERLELCGIYADGPMHETGLAEKTTVSVLQYAETGRKLGASYVTTNPHPKRGRISKTDAELATQARSIEQLAGALKQRGMRLLLHHHDPEMAEGAREWRHLLENTRAEICIDVDWVWQGGQQPLELISKAGDRLAGLHLRNARGRVWTEWLGEGDYDYGPVAAQLRKQGFTGYLVVELALRQETVMTRSLEENLRRSLTWTEREFRL